jgi:mono/diheme cytochrome c family protein
VVNEEERDLLVSYLAANFSAVSDVGSSASLTRGAALFQRSCLGCHGVDMVAQQRLGSAGWGREIDKMARWGAAVSGDEKDVLVEYLATQFGSRRQ